MNCTVMGCLTPRRRGGYCPLHYYRFHRYGDPVHTQLEMHGLSKLPEYKVWKSMRYRCRRPNSQVYKYYGARGIDVCERWYNSFSAFISDMGRRPTSNHSIERIDNDGDYTSDNCKWATKFEQVHNRRISRPSH